MNRRARVLRRKLRGNSPTVIVRSTEPLLPTDLLAKRLGTPLQILHVAVSLFPLSAFRRGSYLLPSHIQFASCRQIFSN